MYDKKGIATYSHLGILVIIVYWYIVVIDGMPSVTESTIFLSREPYILLLVGGAASLAAASSTSSLISTRASSRY